MVLVVVVLQATDTHLSVRSPEADRNWSAVAAHVNRRRPDLVVHTGDISLDGARDPADLAYARSCLDRLEVPWLAVPGNYDVGDVGDTACPITPKRRDRYIATFGREDWTRQIGDWRFIGVDCQTLATSDRQAADSWARLGSELAQPGPTALFLHRPLFRLHPAEVSDAPQRYLTAAARDRLHELASTSALRLVASGHVHQWHRIDHGDRAHVWAPSTWATLPDERQPTIGRKVVGIVEHRFDDHVTSSLVEPVGIDHHVIGLTFPSPYDH